MELGFMNSMVMVVGTVIAMGTPLLATMGILLGVYLLACLWLWLRQNRLIFFPSPHLDRTPADLGLDYEEVWVPIPHQPTEKLHGWWIPQASSHPNPERVLLYLHGNSDNISANVTHAGRFHRMGFSVLIVDYRGYGRSPGAFPSERQVYADADAAWQYLTQTCQIPSHQIWLYGHSLGGAIAIDLASHTQAAGLIVESSFTSMADMSRRTTSFDQFFPIGLLLHQRFDSMRKIATLQLPILLIHGTQDFEVPSDMSPSLFAIAPEPKQLFLVPGADHDNVAQTAGDEYFRVVQDFVARETQRRSSEVATPDYSNPR